MGTTTYEDPVYEDKRVFVLEYVEPLVREATCGQVRAAEYLVDADSELEWVRVEWKSGRVTRCNVTGDSRLGLTYDVMRHVHEKY